MPRHAFSLLSAAIMWTFASTVYATAILEDDRQGQDRNSCDQKAMKPCVSDKQTKHPKASPLIALEMVGIDIIPPQPPFSSRTAPSREENTTCSIM